MVSTIGSDICHRVLVVSNDPVGAKVAGLGMRYLEIARTLSCWFAVTLAASTQ